MISLKAVTVTYGAVVPLNEITQPIGTGSTAISGPSGSGKSTLLRLIAGLQSPSQGEVLINGSPVLQPTWRTASDPRVAMVHQDYRLVPFLTVEENLRLAAELRGCRVSSLDVATALAQVALDVNVNARLPHTLSGGQQQRVAIARALIVKAAVIVADEPTGSLDADNTALVADILQQVGQRSDVAVVVATHDPTVANAMGHHLELVQGQLSNARASV